MKKKAVAYLRVSKIEQVKNGISLEAQEHAIRSYCDLHSIDLIEVIQDPAISGGKEISKRPGGQRLLARLKAGEANMVIAFKLDRLFRSAINALETTAEWDKNGVALCLLDLQIDTSTAMGRMFLTVMSAVSELERSLVSERIQLCLRHKASLGEFTGGRLPYGFMLSNDRKHLVENPCEQKIINKAKELAAKKLSLRSVARILEAEGMVARTGKRFGPSAIRNMIQEDERIAA